MFREIEKQYLKEKQRIHKLDCSISSVMKQLNIGEDKDWVNSEPRFNINQFLASLLFLFLVVLAIVLITLYPYMDTKEKVVYKEIITPVIINRTNTIEKQTRVNNYILEKEIYVTDNKTIIIPKSS